MLRYSCGIIRDLLPLYVDDIASEDSKIAVKAHLCECKSCQKYYDNMKSSDNFIHNDYDDLEDTKMAENLKNVKKTINKRIRSIAAIFAAVVLVLVAVYILFNVPIKNVPLDDINVTVVSYRMKDIIEADSGGGSTTISKGKDDNSKEYRLIIPDMPNIDIGVTQETIDENEYISIVSFNNSYHIRQVKYADKSQDKVMYIDSFKTTVLNNKVESSLQRMDNIEFREIDKIVFVDEKKETVLWSK